MSASETQLTSQVSSLSVAGLRWCQSLIPVNDDEPRVHLVKCDMNSVPIVPNQMISTMRIIL